MTSLAAPKVALKLQPVPKPVLYAGLAGEMLKNLGMKDDDQIRNIQQAVAEGLIEKVIITGKDATSRIETFTLTIKPFGAHETVGLELAPGKSYLETLDVGLAAAVQHASELLTRRGITPEFRVAWSARARSNPALISDGVKRLNLRALPEPSPPLPVMPDIGPYVPPLPPSPTPRRFPQTVHTYVGPPVVPPNFVRTPVVTIQPAKDPGVTFTHETTGPRR
jgi:hypothetical protein